VLIGVVVSVVVVAAGCVLYGIFVERQRYRLVRRSLSILPADGPRTLTILHLSDLHFVRGERRKTAFVASLPEADVTIVTGDFLAEPEGVETAVAAVRDARGRLASWFVLGSNDYFVPRPLNPFRYFVPSARRLSHRARPGRAADLRNQLEADGWDDLTNVREERDLGELSIELLGLDDTHIARQDLRLAPRSASERFGIAVMHSPDSAPEAAACGYDVVFAGHTHGGQVRLPLVGALVTNSDLPRRLASGMFRMGEAFVHVSPGLGTSKYAPFRFLCRPEATLIELRGAPVNGSPAQPKDQQ